MERPWGAVSARKRRRGPMRKRADLLVLGKERQDPHARATAKRRQWLRRARCEHTRGGADVRRRRGDQLRRSRGRPATRLAHDPTNVPGGLRRGRRRRGGHRQARRRHIPGRPAAGRGGRAGRGRAARAHWSLQQLRRRLRPSRPRGRRQGEARRGRALGRDHDRRSHRAQGVSAAHLPARRLAAREPLQRRPHPWPATSRETTRAAARCRPAGTTCSSTRRTRATAAVSSTVTNRPTS